MEEFKKRCYTSFMIALFLVGIISIIIATVIYTNNNSKHNSICLINNREVLGNIIKWNITDINRLFISDIYDINSINNLKKYNINTKHDCHYDNKNKYKWETKINAILIYFHICLIIGISYIIIGLILLFILCLKIKYKINLNNVELTNNI